ncbi:MAG: aminoacetone oxidase family FAD-binding enzyme, partial [Oscillospiraceae bacterium]|nr:aminoacetone oxidase family FAD-binding enzyme [Oscillospiraceae bacterium]
CPVKTERGKRVFPQSDRARDVTDALSRRLAALGVTVEQKCVTEILTRDGAVCGVKAGHDLVSAPNVLLCTGGCSYPITGSDGSGYELARHVGHTIEPPVASLVPMQEKGSWCARMAGLALRNAGMKLLRDGKSIYSDFGELEFTKFGLDGPTILSASAHMRAPGSYAVEIDLKPALSEEKLDARLLREIAAEPNRLYGDALRTLVPQKLVSAMVIRSGIPSNTPMNSVTRAHRHSLIAQLKHFTIELAGLRPVEEALVTSGGVCVSQVQPGTMESKLVRGLYFAGEVLDLDAYTGGFNLQIAWSTGFAAASAVAKSCAPVV